MVHQGPTVRGEAICPTEGGRGRREVTWASGHLPGNLTAVPAGQAEWGEQRAHEWAAVVRQNRPGWHSQTRGERSEHGLLSTRSSEGHRGGSRRTEGGQGRGPEDLPGAV